jgi:hypothetical protein
MISLLRDDFPDANDFGSEVIPGATKLGMKVQAYLYDGYWEDIGTIEAFYNANLGITKKPIPDFSFYDRSAPIYTQARFLPPSKMLDADVMDSVIGEGCIIQVTPLNCGQRLCSPCCYSSSFCSNYLHHMIKSYCTTSPQSSLSCTKILTISLLYTFHYYCDSFCTNIEENILIWVHRIAKSTIQW